MAAFLAGIKSSFTLWIWLAMRVCSLLPSATEIAFALGLGDSVVGVTHECDYPPEARKKPVVVKSAIDPRTNSSGQIDAIVNEYLQSKKSVYTIDLSRFREANPDVILTQELCDVCAVDYQEVAEAAKSLSKKPKIVSLTPASLLDVLGDITRVGEATGKEKEAKAFVDSLRKRIERVTNQASRSSSRPRVACLEWLDPIYTAGHWVPEMVELAGGKNGLGQKGLPSARIDWSRVADFAPEVIVLMPCGFDVQRTLREINLLYRLPGWSELPAVQEKRIFAVNGNAYFSRSGPRLVDGLEILAQIIHPETFPWQAPSEAAQRIG
jgi:iron complex transport system substrate-binding protein